MPSSGRISESVAGKVEIANDLRPQQRDHVRAHRELEAGKNFFGEGRAAQHVAAFEHENFLAGARQISGVDEAVVASADHDHIVFRVVYKPAITPLDAAHRAESSSTATKAHADSQLMRRPAATRSGCP